MAILRVIYPAPGACKTRPFVRQNRNVLLRQCLLHGALLFRGWDIPPDAFAPTVDELNLPSYRAIGSAAPRTRVSSRVYTSNDAPPDATIPFHHELGQSKTPPAYLFFYCERAAHSGARRRSSTVDASPTTCAHTGRLSSKD